MNPSSQPGTTAPRAYTSPVRWALVVALLLPAAAAPLALAGLQLFIGLEARNLQGWWLEMKGFRPEAVLEVLA